MRRPLPALIALAAALAAPATANAAEVVPGEVVFKRAGHWPKTVRSADPAALIARLKRDPRVEYAVRNAKARASFIPNDTGTTGTPGDWQKVQWNFAGPWGVNAPTAWSHTIAAGRPGGKGVKVAVLDTGVAYRKRGRYLRSPDLLTKQFIRGYDFVDGDSFPGDRNGHGTHVASTIAERTNNGIGLTGLAWGASIMPVRVLDDEGEGDASDIARGVRFAARRGADVINLSLEFSSDVTAREIPQLLDAIDYAHRKGAFVVGASGNEGFRRIAYPARASHVVAVGSTTEHGCLSDFSNGGSGLDIVAPGGGADAFLDEPNCRPNERPGGNISQVTLIGQQRRKFGVPGTFQGTSMAVPHVAAAAALVIASGAAGPNPGPRTIEHRLKATARDLGAPGYDTRYGAGLLDAAAASDPNLKTPPAR